MREFLSSDTLDVPKEIIEEFFRMLQSNNSGDYNAGIQHLGLISAERYSSLIKKYSRCEFGKLLRKHSEVARKNRHPENKWRKYYKLDI